jgi:hypothetical protein
MNMKPLLKIIFTLILSAIFTNAVVKAEEIYGPIGSMQEYSEDKISEGLKIVNQKENTINTYSKQYGVSPDWIKSIIIAGTIRSGNLSDSRIPPTYIDAVKWNGLDGVKTEQFKDVDTNIRLCALLLKRIQDRLLPENQNLQFIATLYDNIASNQISDLGRQVEKICTEKLWERE